MTAGLVPSVLSAHLCMACPVARAPEPATATPSPAAAAPSSKAAAPDSEARPPFAWRHEFVAAPEAGTFAVVDLGTKLRKHPRSDSKTWTVDGWHPRVVKVLGRQGDFIEVELDWPEDLEVVHCLLAPASLLGLRMFVREEELADVTTASVSMETGDEAGVVAAPGVLVRTHEEGPIQQWVLTARLHVQRYIGTASYFAWSTEDSLSVEVSVPIPAVGKLYTPMHVDSLRQALRTPVRFSTEVAQGTARRIHYGEGPMRLRGEVYSQSSSDPDHVVVGAPCLQIAGLVSGTEPGGAAGGGGGALSPVPRDSWTIPAETALTWRSGGAAGRLYRTIELDAAPRRRGDRRCFVPLLGHDDARDLEVCVPAKAVTHVSAKEPPK